MVRYVAIAPLEYRHCAIGLAVPLGKVGCENRDRIHKKQNTSMRQLVESQDQSRGHKRHSLDGVAIDQGLVVRIDEGFVLWRLPESLQVRVCPDLIKLLKSSTQSRLERVQSSVHLHNPVCQGIAFVSSLARGHVCIYYFCHLYDSPWVSKETSPLGWRQGPQICMSAATHAETS